MGQWGRWVGGCLLGWVQEAGREAGAVCHMSEGSREGPPRCFVTLAKNDRCGL